MKSGQRKLGKLTRVARNAVAKIKPRRKKGRGKRFSTILEALRYFCTHTTLHGLRYIVDPKLHVIERLLWLLLFVASSSIASIVIYRLALRFQVIREQKPCRYFRVHYVHIIRRQSFKLLITSNAVMI